MSLSPRFLVRCLGLLASAGLAGCTPGGSGSTADTDGGTASTGEPPSTTSESTSGEPTSTTGADSTGSSSTGPYDGPRTCAVPGGGYGNCKTELGWVFDGEACRRAVGCDCADDCALFFPDALACARGCAEAGHCRSERIQGFGLVQNPVKEGDTCAKLLDCDVSLEASSVLESFFSVEYTSEVEPPCESGGTARLFWGVEDILTPDVWQDLCAISLLNVVDVLWCGIDP